VLYEEEGTEEVVASQAQVAAPCWYRAPWYELHQISVVEGHIECGAPPPV
jgi:hypothetical protein